MGQMTIRHNLSPNPRRNPNPNPNPSPFTGQIKILRRGDLPTAFLERETPPPPSDYSGATCHGNVSETKKEKRKKTRNNKKKVVFRDCDDVDLFYSATCRLGPEPEMVKISSELQSLIEERNYLASLVLIALDASEE